MNLLLEIARCPNVRKCVEGSRESHPCAKVVRFQHAKSVDEYQAPEPWSGNIERAPILFVSSNPSYSFNDDFPVGAWLDEHIVDYFVNRFGGGRKQWTLGGIGGLQKDGTHKKTSQFRSQVRRRAIELLEREVHPGIDYALTEVVHCKSWEEYGVPQAVGECAKRYLRRVLELSVASVIVVLGRPAGSAVRREFEIPDKSPLYGPTNICGRERILVFLPNPNARLIRTFEKCLSPSDLDLVRSFLRS